MGENNENICISLIVSTKKEAPLRKQNESIIRTAFNKLRDILEQRLSKKMYGEYISKLRNLEESIEYKKLAGGIGFFFNNNILETIYFENPVKDKLLIDDNFEIKEILLEEKNSLQAHIILLNENHVRLLESRGEDIKEITNNVFPFKIENEFEFPESQNVLSRVPEESDIKMKRITSGLREAEKNIVHYIKNKNLPVIICGLDKILCAYKKINRNEFPDSHYYAMNFDKASFKEIGTFVHRLLTQLYENEAENLLIKLQNKSDKALIMNNIDDIWYASLEKKGDKLFVEESFVKSAILDKSTGEVFTENLDTLRGDNYKYIPDIVNVIIENVVFAGGKVYFLSKDKMKDYGEIVMSLRY